MLVYQRVPHRWFIVPPMPGSKRSPSPRLRPNFAMRLGPLHHLTLGHHGGSIAMGVPQWLDGFS